MKRKKKDNPAVEPKTIEELAKLLRRAKRCWPSVGSYEMLKLASRYVRKVVKKQEAEDG